MKLTIHCTLTHTEYTIHRHALHQALHALAPLIHQAITGQPPPTPTHHNAPAWHLLANKHYLDNQN